MKPIKSERLKKLETELNDLEQWLKLGLVPKKDIPKHKEEILAVQAKISEEKERLQFLKESGEPEDYVAPKRAAPRASFTEMPTIPDIEMGETAANLTDSGFETETDTFGTTTTISDEEGEGETNTGTQTAGGAEETQTETESEGKEEYEEDSYFSDRKRWSRGRMIIDPDADEW